MAVTREEVAELYVAFFDRAPDAAGLDYWVNDSGLTIEEISQSFFDQPETQAKYPNSLSDSEFIDTIYENIFNHPADAAGLDYWVNELETGSITRPDMILAIANGALGVDQLTLDNKTEVGLYYADAGLNDVADATSVMAGVTADPATVVAAEEAIDELSAEPGGSADLTLELDTLIGGSGADTFNGTDETYTQGDSIDGAAGNDTFNLILRDVLVDNLQAVHNVETIKIDTVYDSNTISAQNWHGVETYDLTSNGTNNLTIDDISDTLSTVNLNKVRDAQAFTLNLAPSVNTGITDSLSVALASSTNTATLNVSANGTGDLETLNITSTSNAVTLGATVAGTTGAELDISGMDASLTSITLTGDSGLKLTTSATQVTTVDASALKDSFVYASTTSGVTSETINGGAGDDIIEATDIKSIIDGGAGDDIITAGSGRNTIDGGKGDDDITTGDGRSTISGGDGNDDIITGDNNDVIDGGAGDDRIQSHDGNDIITGGAGADTILVGTGINIITGGAGIDTITLAGGTDTVVYTAKTDSTNIASDLVTGFASGTDKIDVSAIVANATLIELDAAYFFSAAAGMTDGDKYDLSATPDTGVTHAYLNTTNDKLFIDLNQNNIFDEANDLVIDLDVAVAAGDILV